MISKKRVLIADYKNWDSLIEIPYLFKLADCIVDIYSCRGSWLSKSKYVDTIYYAEEYPNMYINKLEDLVENGNYDWVVLGDDYAVRLVAQFSNNDNITKKLLPISDLGNRHILGSKAGFSKACTKYNILTPKYEIYTGNEDLPSILKKISFPLLLKIDESAGGAGVFFCNTLSEVSNYLEALNEKEKHNLVIQKYINGENIAIETIYKNGKLVMYSYAKVTKTLTNEFGIAFERIYYEYRKIEKDLKYIGQLFAINGFCCMTFIRDKDNHYLIESDFRPQSWYAISRIAGINFEKGIRGFFSDKPILIPPTIKNKKREITIRHFTRGMQWNMQNKNLLGIIWLCINKNRDWRTLPWHDSKLLRYIFVQKFLSLSRKIKRSINKFF